MRRWLRYDRRLLDDEVEVDVEVLEDEAPRWGVEGVETAGDEVVDVAADAGRLPLDAAAAGIVEL